MGLECEYRLPPKSIFPDDMPRFPNLWLHIQQTLAADYPDAVRLVIDGLAEACGFADDFIRYSVEAADEKARVQGLQPYSGFEAAEYNHDHDLHIRYYYSELRRRGLEEVVLQRNGRPFPCYRLAASIHYEVAQKHLHHPYIDPCPICGRTGEYHLPGDPCEVVHDPLGLELVLYGTVRGKIAMSSRGDAFRSLQTLSKRYDLTVHDAQSERKDVNTLRIGCVIVEEKT